MASLTAAALLVTAAVVLAGVTLGGDADGPTPSRAAADRACPPPDRTDIAARDLSPGRGLVTRVVGQAREPVTLALHPDGSGTGVLGERGGRLLRVTDGRITDQVVLDLSGSTTQDGDGGLLAAAYDPDGQWLYLYRADRARDDVLTAHPLDTAGMPDPSTTTVVLHVDRVPSRQHHGGSLVFGADGMLYVGFGDGGGLGDPRENAQDPSTVLGKVLRIDPTPDATRPYRVPTDNPFVDRPGWRPEIWVLGVRNPFRMGLDEDTGDIWLGDVGQSCWEEIDRLGAGPDGAVGANLGWDRVEGPAPFEGGDIRGRYLAPTFSYPHGGGGCAVVTGYVPRGPAVPDLDGLLLFSDYCVGRLLGLSAAPDSEAEQRIVDLGVSVDAPAAIVPGPAGRPWVLSLEGTVYELERS